jgi:hypothetical protein
VAAGNASFFFFIMGGVEGGGIRTRVSWASGSATGPMSYKKLFYRIR